MKRITFFLIFCLLALNSCKTGKPVAGAHAAIAPIPEAKAADSHQPVNYSDQVTWLLGYFNQSQLRQEPHSV